MQTKMHEQFSFVKSMLNMQIHALQVGGAKSRNPVFFLVTAVNKAALRL